MPDDPDVVNVVHSNPITQAGFAMLPVVVMVRPDISAAAKLVYAYMKYLAWKTGGEVESPQAALSRDLNLGEKPVRGYLKELASAGLIETRRRGLGLPNLYLIHDPLDDRSRTVDSTVQELAESTVPSIPVKTLTTKTNPTPLPPVGKVDRIPVNTSEWDDACWILAAFNVRAGTSFTPKAWAPRIIRRLREHPDLTRIDHEAVIVRVFGSPWWKGPVSPSVIYGNAAIFERSMASMTSPADARRGLTAEEMETYGTVWGPGTGYDSLPEARARGGHRVIEGRTR